MALDPRSEESRACTDCEKRKQRPDIATGRNRAASPPEHNQQCCGQTRDDGFRKKPEHEERERESVTGAVTPFIEFQVEPGGGETEKAGERVLQFGDPRD